DEMSAALGISQLLRIDKLLQKRERVAQIYTEWLKNNERLAFPLCQPYARVSWFVYVVTLAEGVDRKRIIRLMANHDIPVRCYFSPIHLQPYIRRLFGFRGGELPVTESVSQRTLALPFHGGLLPQEIERVVGVLTDAVT
ncbi:MAG: DegT/DnrJ/EryC1/StrS family aminotransferase, partial [Blastocatellia bacterium]